MPDRLYQPETGTLEPRAFSSRRIFRDEQERLFRRSWLLAAPLDWLVTAGDFVTSSLGQLPIIIWRTEAGDARVFVNRCAGSDRRLAESERGQSRELICPCHGWAYSAEGTRTSQLAALPRVETFSGFVFACQDPGAPPLAEWIGDFGWCWEIISQQFAGGMEVFGGASLRTSLRCNWKLAAEAYSGDTYSDLTLTRATREALGLGRPLAKRRGLQIAAGGGAIAVLTRERRRRAQIDDPRAQMTAVLATLFPNISYDGRGQAIHVWHPRSASQTEMQTYCLVGRGASEAVKARQRRLCQQLFGPAGMLTADHEVAWSSASSSARSTRSGPLNLAMGLGQERRSNLPGLSADLASEMNQRAFYDWWQAKLAAKPLPMDSDRIVVSPHAAQPLNVGELP